MGLMTRVNVGLWPGKRPSLGGALGITPQSVSSLQECCRLQTSMHGSYDSAHDGWQTTKPLLESLGEPGAGFVAACVGNTRYGPGRGLHQHHGVMHAHVDQ